MKRIWIILLLAVNTAIPAIGYGQYFLNILPSDSSITQLEFQKLITYKRSHATISACKKEINQVLLDLYGKGFIAASVDSVTEDTLKITAWLTSGPLYKWAQLRKGNVEEGILSETGYRDKLYRQSVFDYNRMRKLLERIIRHCENNGYPFAAIQLDSLEMGHDSLSASLLLIKNQEYFIDSILLNGDAKINPVYIYNYLGVKPGDLYSEKQIRQINARLKELPFINQTKQHEVIFTEENADLVLHLENKKASQINGILGVLPNEDNSDVLITGDARLGLQNALGSGEIIDINWRKLQASTQDFRARFLYPFLLNTPFGIDFDLFIYKRDTLFMDIRQMLGVQYILKGGNYLKIFVNNQSTSLLSTRGLENITALPEYADVNTVSYGMGYKVEKLDYRLNPRRGFSLELSGSAGNKKIGRNPNLPLIPYDSMDLQTVQYKFTLNGDVFVPIRRRSTFNIGILGSWLHNPLLFENELHRIGGLRTLRGFDEESILASMYGVLTLEYRYLLEQNSYFYLFWDGAYYENSSRNTLVLDNPFGFGAGVSFETRAGIFSVNYALGRQFDNPILLRAAKIHFGFVNYF